MSAFIFREEPTFRVPVTVHMPTDEGVEVFEFEGHFRLDPEDELLVSVAAGTPADQRAQDIEALKDVWIGWTEGTIMTPSGASVPVSDEAIDNLLRQSPVRLAVARAYLDATVGDAVRLGNSAMPRGPSGNRAARRKATSTN